MKNNSSGFRKARWIWCEGDESPVNAVADFRFGFRLGEIPASTRLLISADNRFVAYLNGKRVGYGPPRNYPEHYQYEVFEVEVFLRPGANVLAVKVIYWGEGTFQSMPSRAGLIAELLDGNGQTLVATGTGWKGRLDPAYRRDTARIACQLGFEEQVEAAAEDWLESGYADAQWPAAVEIGKAEAQPWGRLQPSTIPPLTDEIWNSVSVKNAGVWQMPALVIGLRTNENLTPGNRMVNSDNVSGFFATQILAGAPGRCKIRRCAMYGGPIRVFLDGDELELTQDEFDLKTEGDLKIGTHLFVVEWNGITHDKDVAFAFSGIESLQSAPFPQHPLARWIFTGAGRNAEAVRTAKTAKSLFHAVADWTPVLANNAPTHDTYMSISSSVPDGGGCERTVRLPTVLEPLRSPGRGHRIVIDFSRHGLGFLEIECDASSGAVVEMLGCEGAGNGRLQLTEMMSNCARYSCREGRQTFSSIVPRGLRYLILHIRPGERPFVLRSARLRVATYPWKPEGFFRCSDPRLNQIYELCCHTLRMSSMDVFVDATYEQALWVGDMASMTLPVHFYVQGDPRLPARCLRIAGQSLERFPMAQSQVPSAWTNRILPNWSFFWVLGVRDYYIFTGDKAFLRELMPALLKQAAFVLATLNGEGLFEHNANVWHFLDWNGLETDHEDTKSKIFAHENLLALAAFQATAFLAQELRLRPEAARLNVASDKLCKTVRRLFQNPKTGAFWEHRVDGKNVKGVTTSTQICAFLAGLTPGKPNEAALQMIAPPQDWVPTGTPWMWSLGALMALRAGHAEEVLAGMRWHWGRMLDQGATTAWEMFEGGHRPGLPTRSWCHGWSAGPAWLLPAYILGARPAAPGWKNAVVEPVLGDLEWAEGRIPTPRGIIEVAWEKTGNGVKLNVKLPPGVKRVCPPKR